MKKIHFLLLSYLLSFAFASCGSDSKDNQTLTAPRTITLADGSTRTASISGGAGSGNYSVNNNNPSVATADINSQGILTVTAQSLGDANLTISKAGDGTYKESNSVTITAEVFRPVETTSDLQAIGEDATSLSARYIQTRDIDFSSTTNFNPIGTTEAAPFRGTFDGDGFEIRNLTINKNSSGTGLFGYTDGTVLRNIALLDVNITGGTFGTGSLAGYSTHTTIQNSRFSGKVSGNSFVGGLVGVIYLSSVTGSYSTVNVSGGTAVGGLVGFTNPDSNSTISNSYAIGSVVGTGAGIGGLFGLSQPNGITVQNSYAMAQVSGGNQVGGLVGLSNHTVSNSYSTSSVKGSNTGGLLTGNNPNNPRIVNSYWNLETSGQANSDGGTARNSSQMLSGRNTFSGFGGAWNFGDNASYPTLFGNRADANLQMLHQVAGMMRLADDSNNFLGDTNLQRELNIAANSVTTDSIFFVLDTNLEATNDSARADFWDCASGSGDIILTTQSVNSTNIELRFGTGTTDKTAWQKSTTTEFGGCAVVRSNTGLVQVSDKLNLDAIISKGTGTNKKTYTKKFTITFQ